MEESSFQFAFYGEGYKEGQDPTQGKPNSKIRTVVQGPGNWKIINVIFDLVHMFQSFNTHCSCWAPVGLRWRAIKHVNIQDFGLSGLQIGYVAAWYSICEHHWRSEKRLPLLINFLFLCLCISLLQSVLLSHACRFNLETVFCSQYTNGSI